MLRFHKWIRKNETEVVSFGFFKNGREMNKYCKIVDSWEMYLNGKFQNKYLFFFMYNI